MGGATIISRSLKTTRKEKIFQDKPKILLFFKSYKTLYPDFPLVSPYGDLAQRQTDYWRTNEGKNLKKIANPQAFSIE